jgi:hypothetical protein
MRMAARTMGRKYQRKSGVAKLILRPFRERTILLTLSGLGLPVWCNPGSSGVLGLTARRLVEGGGSAPTAARVQRR